MSESARGAQAPPSQGRILPANTAAVFPSDLQEREEAVERDRRRLWWRWVGFQALLLAVTLAAAYVWLMPRELPPAHPLSLALAVVWAGATAVLQALAIRPFARGRGAGAWAVATFVGGLLAAGVGIAAEAAPAAALGPPGPGNALRMVLLSGPPVLLAALPQWLVLRRAAFRRAGWWLRLAVGQGLALALLMGLIAALTAAGGEPEAVEADRAGDAGTLVVLFVLAVAGGLVPAASVLIRVLLPRPERAPP